LQRNRAAGRKRQRNRGHEAGEGKELGEIRPADHRDVSERKNDAKSALDALCPDEMAPGYGSAIAIRKFVVPNQQLISRFAVRLRRLPPRSMVSGAV
jgi:hypothetical protein